MDYLPFDGFCTIIIANITSYTTLSETSTVDLVIQNM
jgi:hypothetical protein